MKEMFNKVIDSFRPVKESIDNGRVVVHDDYKVVEEVKEINFKMPIARHVLNQRIISKKDFISFVNEYKTKSTKIFYDECKISAVFNYSTNAKADYGDSNSTLTLEETSDFRDFKTNQAELSQKTFVRFLKKFEPYIVAFDNKKTDDMDIIEMAEHLQAIKTVDSVERNAEQKFHLDVTIKTGKSEVVLPKVITFEFPIFKNDMELKTKFETELFLSANDGGLMAELICYNIEQLKDETVRELTESIINDIQGVDAFQVA